MKKFLIMACMAAAATTSFAQEDALKSLLKADAFSDAKAQLDANISTFDNEQKAKAYNHLVDLSMKKVNAESAIINANLVATQMKQGDVHPFDTIGYYDGIYNALVNALECDKYDNMPNAKGKVKPKYHSANQNRLYTLRPNLINAGQVAGNSQNYDMGLKYFGAYITSANAPLFKEVALAKDPYLGEVSRVAAIFAYQNKDNKLANKYVDIAMTDSATYKDAVNLKLFLMSHGLESHADSVACLKQLEEMYAKDSKDDRIFGTLASMYTSFRMMDKQKAIIDAKMKQDPNNFMALSLLGQNAMTDSKFDEAIELFKKAIDVQPNSEIILTYLGFCLNSKAAALDNKAEKTALYKESEKYLEKVRDLDPTRQKANWSYPLYQCYYQLYGGDDSRTKEIEAYIK